MARPRLDHTESTNRIGPHTDLGRNWTFNYYTDCGGYVNTVWYKAKNMPLVIPGFVRFDTDQDLDEIVSVNIPAHTWMLLNVRVLHDAIGIVLPRSSLMIDFDILPQEIAQLKTKGQFLIRN